ncbi:coiled-coil domain-containing protein 174-like [Homarus americanus]|uniref:coiled-coil domain-containing protein 174-like n=1 Tax=Homarus americanus TaxID=6706 RepID=UPI001C437C02|nr:coiled-coil domain-containing protein 174-like [Homarus americanus]XP_042218446.1 coiled-coil domain-containing protein 174-like [Homarus americanus]XP_042218447.1 coiled-coil domain-containing protein 174-like [Homarus americanus]
MESGLVGLRAELHKKRAEASKFGAGQKGQTKRDGGKQKKSTSFQSFNAGVSDRDARDKQQQEEETITQEKSRSMLEKKAALYERLQGGVEALENDVINQKFLVNFQKKIVDEVLEKKKIRTLEENRRKEQSKAETAHPDDYKTCNDEDEWVEYTDAFGRTRECLRKDLPAMLEYDKELARDINEDGTSDKPDLLSEDVRREIQRQKWEREEEANALKKDLHYQDVLFEEARTHGAGFMKFSRDEKERKEQMDLLKELRDETQRGNAAKAASASKKKKILQTRLEKVRQRKRLKMGLPITDDKLKTPPASDDEEENGDLIGPPPLSGIIQEDKPSSASLEDSESKEKITYVREWDFGKEGVTSTLSQEQWVERQRIQRNDEFAPPSFYESQKKRKHGQQEEDGVAPSHKKDHVYPTGSHITTQSNMWNKHDHATECSNHAKTCTDDNSGDDPREERDHAFAPPPTFEYYGTSGHKSRNRHARPKYAAMEEAISKGLSHLRKMNDK